MSNPEFSELFSLNPFSSSKKEPASAYPPVDLNGVQKDVTEYDFTVKYGKFFINEEGNEELSKIMESCMRGEKVLCWEQMAETKEGEVYVTIKYMIPKEKERSKTITIPGRRRRKKANIL